MSEEEKRSRLSIHDNVDKILIEKFFIDDDVLPEDSLPEVLSKWRCNYHYSLKHMRVLLYAHIIFALVLAGMVFRLIVSPSAITVPSTILVALIEFSIAFRLYGVAVWGNPMIELPWVTKIFMFYPDILSDAWRTFSNLFREDKLERKLGMRTKILGRKKAIYDESVIVNGSDDDSNDKIDESKRERYGVKSPGLILNDWMVSNQLSAADIARASDGKLTVKNVIGMIRDDKGFNKKSNIEGLAEATNATVDEWNTAVSDWDEASSE